jgi:formyltetrahydrofolate synthetase
LSENDWEWLDEKAEGNRSQFLRETITNYLGAEKMSEIEVQYIVNGKDQVLLNNLKEQAIKQKNAISNNSTNINNHDLVTSTISNLEFFIENLSDVYE